MKRKMTRLARGRIRGARAANGPDNGAAVARSIDDNIPSSARLPNPALHCRSICRRETGGGRSCGMGSVAINELVRREQGLAEGRPGGLLPSTVPASGDDEEPEREVGFLRGRGPVEGMTKGQVDPRGVIP